MYYDFYVREITWRLDVNACILRLPGSAYCILISIVARRVPGPDVTQITGLIFSGAPVFQLHVSDVNTLQVHLTYNACN